MSAASRFDYIIYKLFGKRVLKTAKEMGKIMRDAGSYYDIHKENIIALVSNALALYAVSDSDINIIGENERSKMLNEVLKKHTMIIKNIVSVGLGTGMCAGIPYFVNDKVYIDNVGMDRIFITGMQGDDITQITVAADTAYKGMTRYIRWTDYSIENNLYIIRQRATKENEPCALNEIEEWSGISAEIVIPNVEKLPIGIFKSPKRDKYSNCVPITFGCESTLNKIADTFADIEEEYEDKKSMIFADESMFTKNNTIEKNVFYKLNADEGFYEVYSPEIRNSAYFEKLEKHFEFLEKQIGCSRGILTDMQSRNATATEIKRSMLATYSLCTDVHNALEDYFSNLMYGVNILANYGNITPMGEYELKFDWSYSLLEDSEQTFRQLQEGQRIGAVSKAELRSFITGEDIETAEEKIKEIENDEPGIESIMNKLEQ